MIISPVPVSGTVFMTTTRTALEDFFLAMCLDGFFWLESICFSLYLVPFLRKYNYGFKSLILMQHIFLLILGRVQVRMSELLETKLILLQFSHGIRVLKSKEPYLIEVNSISSQVLSLIAFDISVFSWFERGFDWTKFINAILSQSCTTKKMPKTKQGSYNLKD